MKEKRKSINRKSSKNCVPRQNLKKVKIKKGISQGINSPFQFQEENGK